jgi:hypothetical protein
MPLKQTPIHPLKSIAVGVHTVFAPKGACTERDSKMVRPVDDLLRAISLPNTQSIHFLDMENLLGTGLFFSWQVSQLQSDYVAKVGASKEDLYFIAAGPQNRDAVVTGWQWGSSFFQFRKGKDGADLALVGLFHAIQAPELYSNIYVASGDYLLSEITRIADSRRIPVTVVTGKGAQSKYLKSYRTVKLGGLQ